MYIFYSAPIDRTCGASSLGVPLKKSLISVFTKQQTDWVYAPRLDKTSQLAHKKKKKA